MVLSSSSATSQKEPRRAMGDHQCSTTTAGLLGSASSRRSSRSKPLLYVTLGLILG